MNLIEQPPPEKHGVGKIPRYLVIMFAALAVAAANRRSLASRSEALGRGRATGLSRRSMETRGSRSLAQSEETCRSKTAPVPGFSSHQSPV